MGACTHLPLTLRPAKRRGIARDVQDALHHQGTLCIQVGVWHGSSRGNHGYPRHPAATTLLFERKSRIVSRATL